MNTVKEALTRKFGPLPAWAWAAIAGVALFLYRRHVAGGVATSDQSGGGTNPSYYGPYGQDPYSITGSGGGGMSGSGGGSGDGTTGSGSGNPAGAPPTVNVYPPAPTNPGKPGHKPDKRVPKPKKGHKPKTEKPTAHRPRHPATVKIHPFRAPKIKGGKNQPKEHGGPVRNRPHLNSFQSARRAAPKPPPHKRHR